MARAFGLLSQNLQGGSLPEVTYLGSQGNNYAYNSVTFAENEERSPWTPFHVQHGFSAEESTVSVFGGCRSTAFNLGLRKKHWQDHVRNMLRGLNPHNPPTFLLHQITAQQFIDRGGFDTKEKLIQWVHDNAHAGRRLLGRSTDRKLYLSHARSTALNPMPPTSRRRLMS